MKHRGNIMKVLYTFAPWLRRTLLLSLSAAVSGTALLSATALADDGVEESRAAAFRSVQGAQAEQVPGGMLLIAAYGVCWGLLLMYLLRMHAIEKKTSSKITELEERLKSVQGDG